jgi:hypothetical protein
MLEMHYKPQVWGCFSSPFSVFLVALLRQQV